jgi:hypothetical protein
MQMPTSQQFRYRAMCIEERARRTSDPVVKQEWTDIAMEWHALANRLGTLSGEISTPRERNKDRHDIAPPRGDDAKPH